MTAKRLRWLARLLIGTLLFSQLAVAAHACSKLLPFGEPISRASMAELPPQGSAVPAETTDAEMSDCAGMAQDPDDPTGSVCVEHCLYGQQSDRTSTINVPAVLLTALYVIPSVREIAVSRRSAAGTLDALVAASPPHTVLHCVYRI